MQTVSINRVAANGLDELRGRGVDPTPSDVVWLHELGKRTEAAIGVSSASSVLAPVRAGNVVLWPLSIGAGEWYSEIVYPAFGDTELSLIGLAYALAHSYRVDVLLPLADPSAIRRVLAKWKRGMECTGDELASAINGLLPAAKQKPKHPHDEGACGRTDWDAVIGYLVAKVGNTPEFWRWHESRDYVLRLLDIRMHIDGELKGKLPDESTEAFKVFRRAIVAIIRAHEGNADGQ